MHPSLLLRSAPRKFLSRGRRLINIHFLAVTVSTDSQTVTRCLGYSSFCFRLPLSSKTQISGMVQRKSLDENSEFLLPFPPWHQSELKSERNLNVFSPDFFFFILNTAHQFPFLHSCSRQQLKEKNPQCKKWKHTISCFPSVGWPAVCCFAG